jgi:1,4-dihydroxy-2-naphthoate octaprenyltransferase
MGLKWAKNYQHFLIVVPFVLLFIFSIGINARLFFNFWVFIYLLKHLEKVRKSNRYEDFDPELKKVALSTFVLSFLFFVSFLF